MGDEVILLLARFGGHRMELIGQRLLILLVGVFDLIIRRLSLTIRYGSLVVKSASNFVTMSGILLMVYTGLKRQLLRT